MISKYKIEKLGGGWAVLMSANECIVESFFQTREADLEVLSVFENVERTVEDKWDVWVIGNTYVGEPSLYGIDLGEVSQLDMNQYNVVRRLSQKEYDELIEEYDEMNS